MACGLFFWASLGWAAHPANIASARLKATADGWVDLKLRFDILAFLLEEAPKDAADASMRDLLELPREQLDFRLEAAMARMRSELLIRSNATEAPLQSLKFPSADEVHRAAGGSAPVQIPVMVTVTARTRASAEHGPVSLRFPEVLGTVVLTAELPYREPWSEPVEPGRLSSPIQPPAPEAAPPAAKVTEALTTDTSLEAQPNRAEVSETTPPRASTVSGRRSGRRVRSGPRSRQPAREKAYGPELPRPSRPPSLDEPPVPGRATEAATAESPPQGWARMLAGYGKAGFEHILPSGLDHVLFVLGLFLLSTKSKDLLKQISAFTLAHSITLGLSLAGLVRLPTAIVEPLIAASIALVALENVWTSKVHAWRLPVVFLFGLVHGLGFARALTDAGLPQADLLAALIGFNLGVEAGQLAVVALALVAVGWLRTSPRYRTAVVVPVSLLIACIGVAWTIERLF